MRLKRCPELWLHSRQSPSWLRGRRSLLDRGMTGERAGQGDLRSRRYREGAGFGKKRKTLAKIAPLTEAPGSSRKNPGKASAQSTDTRCPLLLAWPTARHPKEPYCGGPLTGPLPRWLYTLLRSCQHVQGYISLLGHPAPDTGVRLGARRGGWGEGGESVPFWLAALWGPANSPHLTPSVGSDPGCG